MQKVLVIGCPGSGKSTFARELHRRTGLPIYYLDMIWHRADRTEISAEEFDQKLDDICQQTNWIIDGNYLRTLEKRLAYCDTVFWLHFDVQACLEGAKSRIGKKREDLPWIEEELDPEFEQYIIDFEHDQIPEMKRILAHYNGELIVFHTRLEMNQWLEKKNSKR